MVDIIHHVGKNGESTLADTSPQEAEARSQRKSALSGPECRSANLNDGTFQEELRGFVWGEKAGKMGLFEERRAAMPSSSKKRKFPDVIVIEDDAEDSEVENQDSDTATRRFRSRYHNSSGWHGTDDSGFAASELSDSSDEEDCVVMEPHPTGMPSSSNKVFLKAKKRPRPAADGLPDSSKKRSGPSDSSDCEIIVDFNGNVRRDWEEAALRRRMGNAFNNSRYRAESEGSTSVSNHANSDAKQSPIMKQRGDTQPCDIRNQEHATDQETGPRVSAAGVGSTHVKEKESHTALDQQDSNPDVSDAGLDDTTEEASLARSMPSSSGHDAESFDDGVDTVELGVNSDSLTDSSSQMEALDDVGASGRLDDAHAERLQAVEADAEHIQAVEADANPVSSDNVVTDRERLKETEEFQRADAEEWARRQLELQKQAQEVIRERKRRRVEAERRIEMEVRQRQRLEEIRQSQLKEEQTSGFKEQVRGRIQSDLERVAATCKDMATLLCRLGIPVDGGAFPTTQQVNAAYKKALLRFHPDRVAALAKGNPSHQVEAEETFKLISRMKGFLPPVAIKYFS